MNRTDFLTQLYAGRTRLEAALARLTPEQMTAPNMPGGWSVKDLLAHLGWWEHSGVEIVEAVTRGDSPPAIDSTQVDAINAQILEQHRAMDLEEVRKMEQAAYSDLVNLAETVSEEQLFDPQRFAWTEGAPLAQWIHWNSFGHYDEHIADLEGLLAENRPALRPEAVSTGTPDAASLPVQPAAPEQGRLNPVVRSAGAFLEREGRDIDKALFAFRFGALPVEQVLETLASYQNPDGGFTRLEFDIAAPQSNPFATELALEILLWIDAPRDHPVVRRVLAYLEETQDEEGNWRFIPQIYQDSLAPWFQGWKWPNINPSCTTAGLLKQLGLGSDRLHARVQALFDRLATPTDLLGEEFYTVTPYAGYLQTEWNFPQAEFYRWGVVWWMIRQHLNNPAFDASHFINLAPRPESAVARRLPESILRARLDQLLADQSPDGGWPTPYDPRWRVWTTIHNLLILRAYGKV